MSAATAPLPDLFAFSYSTPDPNFTFTMSIRQLCTYIQNSRLETSARVISLQRFKRLSGFKHEFILLKICMMSDEGSPFIWFRLDRGAKLDGSAPNSSISHFSACDSVCTIFSCFAVILSIPYDVVYSVFVFLGDDLAERSSSSTWSSLSNESRSRISERQAHRWRSP